MDMLRYGEVGYNSSLSSLTRHANDWRRLAGDLRDIVARRALLELDRSVTPVVDGWFIEKYMVPILVGHISYPDNRDNDHGRYGLMNFTAPLHLFSYQGQMARSSRRWYLLGRPSPIAEDSIRRWTTESEF